MLRVGEWRDLECFESLSSTLLLYVYRCIKISVIGPLIMPCGCLSRWCLHVSWHDSSEFKVHSKDRKLPYLNSGFLEGCDIRFVFCVCLCAALITSSQKAYSQTGWINLSKRGDNSNYVNKQFNLQTEFLKLGEIYNQNTCIYIHNYSKCMFIFLWMLMYFY